MTRERDASNDREERFPEQLFAWLERESGTEGTETQEDAGVDADAAELGEIAGLDVDELRDIADLWQLAAPPTAPDDWDPLNTRIERHELQRRRRRSAAATKWRRSVPLRVAAAVVLAFGLGALASYLGFDRTPALPPTVVAVPAAATGTVELAGGIVVRLNVASTLSYVPTPSGVHEVELDGEAYFEVPHDARREFVVRTAAGAVRDLGTEFNVWARADSVSVAVTDGVVELEAGARSVVVQAGQRSHAARGGPPTAPEPIDTALARAWLRGDLQLVDQPLTVVAAELERRYGVTFRVADALRPQRLTVTIRARSDADAARAICTAVGARCRRLNGGWSIE